ncbi:hypothetical protein F4774DRAFT_217363 [Daldinia eschscholtzii]|nr:hypothetical protein F4774DRAFT_217363 [Daldinia eschscholtzii]
MSSTGRPVNDPPWSMTSSSQAGGSSLQAGGSSLQAGGSSSQAGGESAPGEDSSTNPVPATFPKHMIDFRAPPQLSKEQNKRLANYVIIHHPYYIDVDNFQPLLSFCTSDDGVPYLMVYYGCCAIANNCFHPDEGRNLLDDEKPFLSKSVHKKDRIKIPANDILEPGKYFFIVPGSSTSERGEHYAVTPTFDDWIPPSEVPYPFRAIEIPEDPDLRFSLPKLKTTPCFLSNVDNAIELAHIVPKQEVSWATRNEIRLVFYPASDNVIEDWRNQVPLRKDLHFLWDHSYFTLFPKSITPTEPRDYRLCLHVSRIGDNLFKAYENIGKYQNIMVTTLQGVPAELLFYRFVWNLFDPNIFKFFKASSEFYVKVISRSPSGGLEESFETWPNDEIYYSAPGSGRGCSPRFDRGTKRKAPHPDGNKKNNQLAGDDKLRWASSESEWLSESSSDNDSDMDYNYARRSYPPLTDSKDHQGKHGQEVHQPPIIRQPVQISYEPIKRQRSTSPNTGGHPKG